MPPFVRQRRLASCIVITTRDHVRARVQRLDVSPEPASAMDQSRIDSFVEAVLHPGDLLFHFAQALFESRFRSEQLNLDSGLRP